MNTIAYGRRTTTTTKRRVYHQAEPATTTTTKKPGHTATSKTVQPCSEILDVTVAVSFTLDRSPDTWRHAPSGHSGPAMTIASDTGHDLGGSRPTLVLGHCQILRLASNRPEGHHGSAAADEALRSSSVRVMMKLATDSGRNLLLQLLQCRCHTACRSSRSRSFFFLFSLSFFNFYC